MALPLVILMALGAPGAAPVVADTIRLEVGSPEINGLRFAPHAARVRVRIGESDRLTAEWTNELSFGDSAGRRVARWVTKGTQFPPSGGTITWELLQTYDARTLAPLGYHLRSSAGSFTQLAFDGAHVRGRKRLPQDSTDQVVDLRLDRVGYIASASDLVPLAAGLRAGAIWTAPVWGPNMPATELRVFTVRGEVTVDVEGTPVRSWKVEEHRASDRKHLANWYLLDRSPYMVYGEVFLPNGAVQRMSEVEIPRSMP